MKKITLTAIALFFPLVTFAAPFGSNQLATTSLVAGNILQTDNTNSFWVTPGSLGLANFWSNLGINTTLNTGSNAQAGTFTATSTSAYSVFPNLRNGEIADLHANGSVTYTQATTSTNVGRGNALIYALSQAQTGDSFYLASSTYDLGLGFIDESMGGIGSFSIHGTGEYQTTIIGTSTSTKEYIIQTSTGSQTTDLSIIAASSTVFTFPWARINGDATNALLQNVYIQGYTDGIYLEPVTGTNIIIRNVTINSNWDSMFMFPHGGAIITATIYDSNFTSTYVPLVTNTGFMTHALDIGSNSNANVTAYNSAFYAIGGPTENFAIVSNNIAGGKGNIVNIYGDIASSSQSSNSFDLNTENSNSVINVSSNTIYNPAKTSGVITYIDNSQLRYSLGSNGASSTVLVNENGVAQWQATSTLGLGGTSGSSYPFVPTTNFGSTNQATTGIAWFQNGINASSTSHFELINVASTTGTSVFAGSASTTNEIVSSLGGNSAGTFVATDKTGKLIATTTPSGSGSGTVGSGLVGQVPFYNLLGTVLTASSSIRIAQSGHSGANATDSRCQFQVYNGASSVGQPNDGTPIGVGIGCVTDPQQGNQGIIQVDYTNNGDNGGNIQPAAFNCYTDPITSTPCSQYLIFNNYSGTSTSSPGSAIAGAIFGIRPYIGGLIGGSNGVRDEMFGGGVGIFNAGTLESSAVNNYEGIGLMQDDGSGNITGTGTSFAGQIWVGSILCGDSFGECGTVTSVSDDTDLTIVPPMADENFPDTFNIQNPYINASNGFSNYFKVGSDGNTYINSGNLGIGTGLTAPAQPLTVVGVTSLDNGNIFTDGSGSLTVGTLNGAGLSSCTGTGKALTWVSGSFGCNTITGGSSYPFTLATNFGSTNQATTGIAWFQNGLNASSTSHFSNASTTMLSVATTSKNAFVVKDGFGTSVLNVNTASSTGPILTVQATSSLSTLFSIDQYGHLFASSTPATPTVSSCGTGTGVLTAGSNDVTGDVTTATLATSCTITFAVPYTVTPEILITGGSAASVTAVTSRSTTSFTIGLGTAATGDDISYLVIQP